MSKGKRTRRLLSVKALSLILAVILLVGTAVGGTLAWFTDQTNVVTNTFTVGNVVINLKETPVDEEGEPNGEPKENVQNNYPLVPGVTYTKDPVVTVEADSEKCYLFVKFEEKFVKFEEKNDSATYINYTSTLTEENQWYPVEGQTNVWYRTVEDTDADQSWHLLVDDEITIDYTTVKKDTMAAADQASLHYTAYAVQYYKTNNTPFTPVEAWAEVSE